MVSGDLLGHAEQEQHLGASLKRYLGVCYRTAWRIKHKLLEAMAERDSRRQLFGLVMADDAYLGRVHTSKPGRGSENKEAFVAAVELNEEGHPQHVRCDPIEDLKGTTTANRARKALREGVHLVAAGLASFASAGAVVAEHDAIIVSPRPSSDLEVFDWVNIFIANLKTAIGGTYHHFDFKKCGARYLTEARYRLNRHFELRSLVDRLLGTCSGTAPRSEDWLRLGVVGAS
jgi:hypothetical protein